MREIRSGDVVRLKSSRPSDGLTWVVLTVYHDAGTIRVIRDTPTGTLRDTFRLSSVEVVSGAACHPEPQRIEGL